jgi:hypothetical protein
MPIRYAQEAVMEKVYGLFEITGPGEWKLTIEILNNGSIVGYVDRIRTESGKFIVTRNLQGDIVEGECLEWLLRQTA